MKEVDLSEFLTSFESSGPIQKMNQTGLKPELLFNAAKPKQLRKKEQPAHTAMAQLAAEGYQGTEIARILGRHPHTVNDVLRQPYAQDRVVKCVRDTHGTDHEVVEIIKETVVAAVNLLAETIVDSKQKRSDRILAAEKILERRYGKANQPINRGTDVDLNSLSDAELAKMLPTSGTGTNT